MGKRPATSQGTSATVKPGDDLGDLPELDVFWCGGWSGSANDPYMIIIIMCIYIYYIFFIYIVVYVMYSLYFYLCCFSGKDTKEVRKLTIGLSAPKMDHQQPCPARFQ